MTLRSTTITDGGRAIRGRIVAAFVVFGVLVALVILASATDRTTVVDGPSGSSFVTTPNGTAALFELIDRTGRESIRLAEVIGDDELGDLAALVIAEPGLSAYAGSEVRAITRWVDAGGRLVVAGRPPAVLLDALEIDLEWSLDDLGPSTTLIPKERTIDSGRFGSWPEPGATLPWASNGEAASVVVVARGLGLVALIADLGVVTNEGIRKDDNASVVLELIGPGPVGFDEIRHGYTDVDTPSILDAAPGNWSTAAPLLVIAVAAALVAYGRRFGPPEPSVRTMIPGRESFLGSMGDLLRRAGDAGTVAEPLRRSARRMLEARAGSNAPESLARAASSAGLTEDEYHAIFSDSPESAFDADRALAKLSSHRPGGSQ